MQYCGNSTGQHMKKHCSAIHTCFAGNLFCYILRGSERTEKTQVFSKTIHCIELSNTPTDLVLKLIHVFLPVNRSIDSVPVLAFTVFNNYSIDQNYTSVSENKNKNYIK